MPQSFKDRVGEQAATEIDGWMHGGEVRQLQAQRAGLRLEINEARADAKISRFWFRWAVCMLVLSWALFLFSRSHH
jgi:hypothetical protein